MRYFFKKVSKKCIPQHLLSQITRIYKRVVYRFSLFWGLKQTEDSLYTQVLVQLATHHDTLPSSAFGDLLDHIALLSTLPVPVLITKSEEKMPNECIATIEYFRLGQLIRRERLQLTTDNDERISLLLVN